MSSNLGIKDSDYLIKGRCAKCGDTLIPYPEDHFQCKVCGFTWQKFNGMAEDTWGEVFNYTPPY